MCVAGFTCTRSLVAERREPRAELSFQFSWLPELMVRVSWRLIHLTVLLHRAFWQSRTACFVDIIRTQRVPSDLIQVLLFVICALCCPRGIDLKKIIILTNLDVIVGSLGLNPRFYIYNYIVVIDSIYFLCRCFEDSWTRVLNLATHDRRVGTMIKFAFIFISMWIKNQHLKPWVFEWATTLECIYFFFLFFFHTRI